MPSAARKQLSFALSGPGSGTYLEVAITNIMFSGG